MAEELEVVHVDVGAGLPGPAARARRLVLWLGDRPVGWIDVAAGAAIDRALSDAAAHRVAEGAGIQGSPDELLAGTGPDGAADAVAPLPAGVTVVIRSAGDAQRLQRCRAAIAAGSQVPGELLVRGPGAGTDALASNAVIAFVDEALEPHPRWLERLCAPFADPDVAAVAGLALERGAVPAGAPPPPLGPEAPAAGAPPQAGATLAIRAEAVRRTGGWDERLPAGDRDAELWNRLRGARWTVRRAPDAVAFHDGPLPRPRPGAPRLPRGPRAHPARRVALRAFLARNPFPHPLTEGFFYREKMRAIHRVAPDVSPERVLEVGGGRSGLARLLYPASHVTTIDMDPEHASAPVHRDPLARFEVADATDLPFPDASFDVVTMLDVLEHIPDDRAAASEAWRVLKPGGHLLASSPNEHWRSPYHRVMAPICPSDEEMIARWVHVRRGYTIADYTALFGRPPDVRADFINRVTVVCHDLAFSHLPPRVRRALCAAVAPATWLGYALQPRGARGTESAVSWRKPAG